MSQNLSPELQNLRRRYSDEALRSIPKLLQLIDRNRYSKTYGSFDRSYWHYRTMDFPCGMSQEFCLPLALVYKNDYPDNPYYQQPRMKELALAGIDFARKSAHPDGTCDDYFPFEQALGAMVFSLYACTETCIQLGEKSPEFLEFFARRGDYLIKNNESGQLANHQAFAALALHNVYELTGEQRFAQGRDQYLDIVASWQSSEGWFQEYEGADPGYHSCSISFLAKLFQKTKGTSTGERILAMLRPAVEFAWYFMHPDGSYAGEYGSRNTYHFYPYGFEVMAAYDPKAGQIADQFLKFGLPRGSRYFNEDDRMCAHYVYDWLESYRDFNPERPEPLNDRPNFTKYFPKAQIVVKKTDAYYAVLSLAKGGVLKMYSEEGPLYSDTGMIGELEDGSVLVTHLVGGDEYDIDVEVNDRPQTAEVSGRFAKRKTRLATPATQILFRLLNLSLGRFAPDLLRSVLQKILITGKPWTHYRFTRRFIFADTEIQIVDKIQNPMGQHAKSNDWVSLHLGSDATSIYVANSNVYQQSVLVPWQDLSLMLKDLSEQGHASYRHNALGTEPAEDSFPGWHPPLVDVDKPVREDLQFDLEASADSEPPPESDSP